MDREADDRRLEPDSWTIRECYLPEGGFIVKLTSLWLEEAQLEVYRARSLPAEVAALFERRFRGRKQYLFLIHPASTHLYRKLSHGTAANRCPTTFWASPTSSARTLIVWPENNPAVAFQAKLSLDCSIGKLRRTISRRALCRSVGTSTLLDGCAEEAPSALLHFREVLGLNPRGMTDGGLIVRTLPTLASIRPQHYFVPFFSLYSSNDRQTPLLLRMASRQGICPRAYIRNAILLPFARFWSLLAIEHGIVMEPHAQNLLLEVDQRLAATGRIAFRDMEDVYVDFRYRELTGRYMPDELPIVTAIRRDYKQHIHRTWLHENFDYFEGGVVFPLERRLNDWIMDDLISGPLLKPGTLKREFRAILNDVLRVMSGGCGRFSPGSATFTNLIYRIRRARIRAGKQYEKLPLGKNRNHQTLQAQ